MQRLKWMLLALVIVGLGALVAFLLVDDPHARRGPVAAPTPVAASPASSAPSAESSAPTPDAATPTWPEDAPRTLHGTVRNPAGEPVAGATVLVVLRGQRDRRTTTGREGRYTLAGVPARADRLEFSARGYEPDTHRRPSFPAAPRVQWDAELTPAEGVHGIVLSGQRPAEGAWVTLRMAGARRPVASARADSSGRFALPWRGTPPLTVTARHGQFGKASVEVSEPGEVTLELPGGGLIAGRVIDEDGDPVTSFSVSATPMTRRTGGPPAQSFEAPDGQFLLGPLSEGTHRVWAAAETFQPGEARAIEVRVGETTDGVVLKLKRSAFLLGRVTDARTRRPVEGALVLPAEWRASALAEAVGTYTDADGRYRLTALPGVRTSIRVTADGYRALLVGGVEGRPGQEVVRDFDLSPMRRDEVPASELTGIGAVLRPHREGVALGHIFDGGPASEMLDAGDVVVMVDDERIRGRDLGKVAQAIRGEEDTEVVLWVKRGGRGEPERVVLTRGRVTMPDRHHRNIR